MNELINSGPVMSSVELVDVINSYREEGRAKLRHDTFLEKIEKVLGAAHQNFLASYKDSTGRTLKCYHLPKREASLMVMSESYVVQAKVYDRMTELEGQVKTVDPIQVLSDPAAMRGLLLSYTEKVLTLEEAVKTLAPKAEAFELISASEDALTYTEAAKVLGVKRKDLVSILHVEGWHFRQNKSWVAYDKFIKNGCLKYKEAKYTDEGTGMECIKPYCHITQKGLAKLAGQIVGKGAAWATS